MTDDEKSSDVKPGISPGEFAPQKVVQARATTTHDLRHLSFRFMQDGFCIVDANGLHVDVNPALCEMTGFSEAELIGADAMFCYWPPEAREEIRMIFANSLREELAEVELVLMRKNGERFPALVNPFPIRDNRGQIILFASTVRDITQRVQMQSALQESEERYRGLFERAADAIVILQGEKIIDYNERAREMFGTTPLDQLASRAAFDFFPPVQPNGQDSRTYSVEKLNEARTGKQKFFAWRHVKLDGTPFDAEVSLSTFKLGESVYTQAIIRDITQRTQMENALKESEQRFRALFESSGDAVMILNESQVIDCNEQALKLTGRTRHDILTNPTIDYFPTTQPSGQNSVEFFLEKVEASRSGIPQVFEWTGQTCGGTTLKTEVTLTTLQLGKAVYTQSIIRDITQRKRLEEALRDSEVRFRTLFESAGDAISINKDSKTIDCNKRLTELYGWSRDEILSATLGEFFPQTQPNGQDSRELFQEMVKASRSGNPQVYEWYGRKRDGTPIITEINLTTFILGGETYEQAIARDITQRKQMEAALVELNATLESRVKQRTDELEKTNVELLQRTTEFRALAAQLILAEHEERKRIARFLHDNQQQLLVAAKYRAEMLLSESYDSDINSAGRNLVEILEQVLEVSRSLTMELAPPVLYGAGLVDAIRWLARWMEEHHHLGVSVIGTLPVTPLPTDVSILVFQVVRELLLNVIKHSGVKQSRVTVAMADQQLLVAVADEGVGFNVDSALESPRSLGLFGIQERLSLLGGRLTIISVPGRGTTSTLSVPVADPQLSLVVPAISEISPAQTQPQQHRGTIRVLVADDHAGARDGLVQVLGLVDDFAVVGQAVDGLDAVEQAGLLRPDVVLMDMTMPRLDGLAATRRITSELPGVKVIGLSMHAREEMQQQWCEVGALAYLQKSTAVDELITAIRAAMTGDPAGRPE